MEKNEELLQRAKKMTEDLNSAGKDVDKIIEVCKAYVGNKGDNNRLNSAGGSRQIFFNGVEYTLDTDDPFSPAEFNNNPYIEVHFVSSKGKVSTSINSFFKSVITDYDKETKEIKTAETTIEFSGDQEALLRYLLEGHTLECCGADPVVVKYHYVNGGHGAVEAEKRPKRTFVYKFK